MGFVIRKLEHKGERVILGNIDMVLYVCCMRPSEATYFYYSSIKGREEEAVGKKMNIIRMQVRWVKPPTGSAL